MDATSSYFLSAVDSHRITGKRKYATSQPNAAEKDDNPKSSKQLKTEIFDRSIPDRTLVARASANLQAREISHVPTPSGYRILPHSSMQSALNTALYGDSNPNPSLLRHSLEPVQQLRQPKLPDYSTISDMTLDALGISPKIQSHPISITKDGEFFAVTLKEDNIKTIYLYSILDNKSIKLRELNSASPEIITSIVFNSDNSCIAGVTSGGDIAIWDVNTKQLIKGKQISQYDLNQIVWKGDHLYAGGKDGIVYVVDSSLEIVHEYPHPGLEIYEIAVSADKQYLAVATFKDGIFIYDQITKTCIRKIEGWSSTYTVEFSPNSKSIAFGGIKNQKSYLITHSFLDPSPQFTVIETNSTITRLAWEKPEWIFSGHLNGTIWHYAVDAENVHNVGNPVFFFQRSHQNKPITSLCVCFDTPDKQITVASAMGYDNIIFIQRVSLKPKKKPKPKPPSLLDLASHTVR